MIVLFLILCLRASGREVGVTPHLMHINELQNVAALNDAQHRGPRWYDYKTDSDSESDKDETSSSATESKSSETSTSGSGKDETTSASSFETKERKMITRKYRACKPCPYEMMMKHKNIGIKWVCGTYQRARRTFKSECMMRYRNCEDGTLFVKLHDHRCENDTYHGRHWFYIYRT